MTECNQSQFEFEAHFPRRGVGGFSGERLTTEGGALLLRAADRKIGLLRRVVRCFTDARAPQRIEHELCEMLVQRIYGLALGYEDLNDHEELRNDPLLGMLAGRRDRNAPLAGKSTLNRLERTPSEVFSASRYHKIGYSPEAIDELLVDIFLEAHRQAPREIVLDLDATDTPLHGRQEARFFHGYYGHYCYLPLYVFCGDHLLCARLRPSNQDASAGSLEEVQRIVRQIRARCGRTAASSDEGCRKPSKSTGARENPDGCSVSSLIARRKAGRGRGAWWPKRNSSKARKIPATWSQNRSIVPLSRRSARQNCSIATLHSTSADKNKSGPLLPAPRAENKLVSPTPQSQFTTGEKSGL